MPRHAEAKEGESLYNLTLPEVLEDRLARYAESIGSPKLSLLRGLISDALADRGF